MLTPGLLPLSFQKPLIVLLSGAAVLWVVKRWPLGRELPEKAFNLGFSLALVTSILVSYHLQLHDLSLLLLPVILVLNGISKGEMYIGRRRLPMLGIILLFFLSPCYLLLMKLGQMYLFFWPILFFLVMLSQELVSPAHGSEPAGRGNTPDTAPKVA